MTTSLQLGALVSSGRLATVHRGSVAGRAVAVKRARPDVPGAAAALRREARILTAAHHPAIVPVLDVLDDPVAPALVLGWADGGSLADLLADGPLPAEELLHILRPLVGGLEALHRAGVAHLDLSVHNVLLAAAGPVLIDPAPPGAGTPGFADPVVAAGGPASPRSDVFGLAACAHVALTGRLPRRSGTVRAAGLPPAVVAALDAGLQPEPRRRPASPVAFLGQLEAALGAAPTPGGPGAGTDSPPLPRAPGRPVVRRGADPVGPARTWPFDHWQEHAEAAAARRAAVEKLVGEPPRRRRRTRLRRAAGVLLLAVSTVVVVPAVGPRSGGKVPTGLRTSASDSTHRPPAARPPPTATPGGNP